MYQGLSICHFPYRTTAENIYYFAKHGYTAISEHGLFFFDAISDPVKNAAFTKALRDTGVRFTVHHQLPTTFKNYTEEVYTEHMNAFRRWQDETGLLWNLSFDVYPDIRPFASKYIRIALDVFQGTDTRISVEDYGLSPAEKADLEQFRGEAQFGFLVDIGHMNVRLHNTDKVFSHDALNQWGEGAPLPPGDGSAEAFKNAFLSKEFPIFELHLHNNSGKGDEHRCLEEGVIDIPGLARVLKEIGFEGVVSMETVPDWSGSPEYVAQQKEMEQEVWRDLDKFYKLNTFRGDPDPKRDARYLESFAYWMTCIENI